MTPLYRRPKNSGAGKRLLNFWPAEGSLTPRFPSSLLEKAEGGPRWKREGEGEGQRLWNAPAAGLVAVW